MFDEPAQNPLIPLVMRSSVETFNQDMPDWPLTDSVINPGQPRTLRTHIAFDIPFTSIPVVQVALTGFDIDNRSTARLTVSADSITLEGFDLLVSTWRDTRVYQVSVSWLALGH